ncbi:MAG: efflux RND transporter permease subunit [Brasilonema octagenarum HA4186-MV1]|jgi:multidrug efflux pump subunit AcrB|uniref:efflux RND transporter permease subunit n=1 Tax=Brasilonema TaxID=383614 RepID=UPI001B7CEE1A|nr:MULTISPECIES: efflux RND transporter permease subunit [Brasilonema]MBW4627326.1 efflux RND transporter permease subunit [Brasilonema octagenarum HA4186-MV1]
MKLLYEQVVGLPTPAEAEDIVVQKDYDGTLMRLKDVGRAVVGAQYYSATTLFDDSPAVILLAYQLPGTNAWNTTKAIKEKRAELQPNFPPG